jgi:geranylgeranyl pyrophosphate synthase
VLLGDFLLSKVFKMCSDLDQEIMNIIADMVVRVFEGGLRQVAQRQNWQLSESEYIDIITEKSASLLSGCCLLGGFLGGASESQAQSLACFGLNAGIAFQIKADLPDTIGDKSRTGKSPGGDIVRNKPTLAVIHLLKAVDERERKAVINSYLSGPVRESKTGKNMMRKGKVSQKRQGITRPAKTGSSSKGLNREAFLEGDVRCEEESLSEMLVRLGSLEYAHNRAEEFVAKAQEALAGFKEGGAKDALIETAKFFG